MKGNILPKNMRVKGKSKYFYLRLKEEKIPLNSLWNGTITESPADKLWKKLKV